MASAGGSALAENAVLRKEAGVLRRHGGGVLTSVLHTLMAYPSSPRGTYSLQTRAGGASGARAARESLGSLAPREGYLQSAEGHGFSSVLNNYGTQLASKPQAEVSSGESNLLVGYMFGYIWPTLDLALLCGMHLLLLWSSATLHAASIAAARG